MPGSDLSASEAYAADGNLRGQKQKGCTLAGGAGEPLKRSVGKLAITLKKPSMLRNSIAVVTGALLSFVLNIAGARLAWLLIIGNVERSENKDAFVRLQLWQTFFVVPAISVVVGSVVASMVPRSLWWLGGVAAIPIFIYGFIRGPYVLESFYLWCTSDWRSPLLMSFRGSNEREVPHRLPNKRLERTRHERPVIDKVRGRAAQAQRSAASAIKRWGQASLNIEDMAFGLGMAIWNTHCSC